MINYNISPVGLLFRQTYVKKFKSNRVYHSMHKCLTTKLHHLNRLALTITQPVLGKFSPTPPSFRPVNFRKICPKTGPHAVSMQMQAPQTSCTYLENPPRIKMSSAEICAIHLLFSLFVNNQSTQWRASRALNGERSGILR